MGMFDTIYCDYPLPDTEVQGEDFQTKDLGQDLDTYRITRDGRLLYDDNQPDGERNTMTGDRNFHGVLRFYTSLTRPSEPSILVFPEDSDVNDINQAQGKIVEMEWYEYEAMFTQGSLTQLQRTSQRVPSFFVQHLSDTAYNLDSSVLTSAMIQSAIEGNYRIVLPIKKPKERKRLQRIADIPAPTLEVIKALRYDRFLEKHEGPWKWESALHYENACLVHLEGKFSEQLEYTILMPFEERHAANIEVINIAESNDMLTVFFVCPSLAGMEQQADNRRWSSFCAVCRLVMPNFIDDTLPLYITLMLHEAYLCEPEMGNYRAFRKLFA